MDVDFQRAKDAEVNAGNSGDLSTQFLRCNSLDKYLDDHQGELSATFLAAHAQLKDQECVQHRFLIGQSSINSVSTSILSAIGKLALVKLNGSDANMTDKEKFLWKTALFRSQLGLKQAGSDFLPRSPNVNRFPTYKVQKRREAEIKSDLSELILRDNIRLQD